MPHKVLHIITKLEFGGAQANTLYTVANLDRKHFEAKAVSGPGGLPPQAWEGILLPEGLRDSLIFAGRLGREINPFRDLAALAELFRIIKKEKPDIVHTHSSKAGILGRLAARLAGTPVIVHTFHGFGFHERQNFLKRSFFIFLERLCAAFSDALIFVSKANMDYARSCGIGGEKKYRLIRSGIALKNYPAAVDRAAKRKELGVPAGAVLVASLGNLKPQKNPAHFIAAAQRLLAEFRDAVFIFVGGGKKLEETRAQVKALGLEKLCLFPGWRRDSAEILAAADIFTLTSLWEGLPRSLVEAMKTGLPPVCYRTDGVADLITDGENGFSPEPGDLETLTARLRLLISDPALRAKMSVRAAASDLVEFDIDTMVRRQESLYAGLLKEKGISL
ncbi:MAG: glycosyltransferase family 4 protein [Elusimicrobia bacterium]|nr:glycosyltransferase family 4 protein [Elusimicrobiota bacterium]